jgi:hypothetical protein
MIFYHLILKENVNFPADVKSRAFFIRITRKNDRSSAKMGMGIKRSSSI